MLLGFLPRTSQERSINFESPSACPSLVKSFESIGIQHTWNVYCSDLFPVLLYSLYERIFQLTSTDFKSKNKCINDEKSAVDFRVSSHQF